MAPSLRAQSVPAGKAHLEEHEAAGHIVFAVDAGRDKFFHRDELNLETLTEVYLPRE